MNGKDHFFSYYDIDIERLGLCTIKRTQDAVFPEYVINDNMIGKKFMVFYQVEERWLDLADEMSNVYVIKKLELLD
jgi:hypothetical protein